MRWSLAVVAFVSACGSDGVQLDVHVGKTGATHVELFLSTGERPQCAQPDANCGAVAPPAEPAPLTPNTVYLRDAQDRYIAEVNGDVATFWLREGPKGGEVPFVIAVGLTGDPYSDTNRNEVGVQRLSLDAGAGRVIYSTTLEAAKPRLQRPADGTGRFVQIWHTGDAEACVIVEDKKDTGSTYTSIVPAEDGDCDGVTELECRPDIYKYAAPVSGDLAQATCIDRVPTGPSPGLACRLGGGCIDGGARCEPIHACVPDGVCNCGFEDLGCMLQAAFAPGFRVECTVPTNNGALCNSASDTLKFGIGRFLATGTSCENFRFNALPRVGQPITPPLINPQSSFITNAGTRVDFGDNLGGGCNVTLKVTDVPPIQAGNPVRERALMLIDASNSFTVTVPLALTFTFDGCSTNDTICTTIGLDGTMATGDSMWNCLSVQ